MIIASIAFVTENTGGGCTALVAYVEGGALVVTDGNLGTDWAWAAEQGEPIVAGWYPGTTWDDGECAANAEGATPDAAVANLLTLITAG